jgi:hypothetical protein
MRRFVREWGWPAIVPVVMLAVFAVHGVRTSNGSSPWIGAGFGMFATVDGHHRVIRFLDEGGTPIEPSPALRESLRGLANDPSPDRLGSALRSVTGAEQVVVLRPQFDPHTNALTWETVRRATR